MNPKLQYSQPFLNRCDHLRTRADELETLWRQTDCRVLLVHQNKHLFTGDLEPVPILASTLATEGYTDPKNKTFLGMHANTPYFCLGCDDAEAQAWCEKSAAKFIDLRRAGPALDGQIASVLAYAQGVCHWQVNNRYCGRCGGEHTLRHAGHMMNCAACATEIYPRTDPAVIMLVEHKDKQGNKKCLLGRNPAWPEGCFSTLAGFVETGESLEAAVVREVFEETGIEVTNPVYSASQPWPFPQSLMLGFVARAQDTEIVLDKNELADAAWFSATEMASFGAWADETPGPKLPRADSIARFLIDSWIAENRQ